MPDLRPEDAATNKQLELPGDDEWWGMPEFVQEDRQPVQKIVVNFASHEDVQAFAKLIGAKFTDKSKSTWFPVQPRAKMTHTAYIDADAQDA